MDGLRRFAVGLTLLLACAPAAFADGPDEPDTELRMLRPAGEASTSACIGDPRTPACAVETYEACLLRGDAALCRTVGRSYAAEPPSGVTLSSGAAFFVYRIFGQRIVHAEDIPAGRTDGRSAWQAGDIVLLAQWNGCGPKPQCLAAATGDPGAKGRTCPPVHCVPRRPDPAVSGEKTVVVRRVDDRWIVVDATYDRVLPDAIWGR